MDYWGGGGGGGQRVFWPPLSNYWGGGPGPPGPPSSYAYDSCLLCKLCEKMMHFCYSYKDAAQLFKDHS